jgi:PAS domain-containing protein
MTTKPTCEELEQRVKKLEKDSIQRDKLEKVLRESEEKYRHVAENVNVGILVVQDLKIVFANTAISQYLGYTKDELLSNPNPFEFIHPDDIEMVFDRHMKRLKDEEAEEVYSLELLPRVEILYGWKLPELKLIGRVAPLL